MKMREKTKLKTIEEIPLEEKETTTMIEPERIEFEKEKNLEL